MTNYEVKIEVEYENGMIVEETYEVFAYDIDNAEDKVMNGEGLLTNEEIVDYPDIVNEKVTSIKRII